MKLTNKYIKRIKRAAMVTAPALLIILTAYSCERRDLWVYMDNFKQVLLDIDWRNYDRDSQLYPHTPDPDGMTVWFFPKDGRPSSRYTTAQVRRFETYLSEGDYEGLVIDYSPEEYSHQEFVGMDYVNTAEVKALPSSYQPKEYPELFGEACYGKTLPKNEETGMYTVAWEPEVMASDTIDMHVKSGKYINYIPYEERDTYQSTLVQQIFNVKPLIIPWRMRVRVYIKGIYYLREVKASLAGMADGFMLAENHTNETPCLLALDGWQIYVDKEKSKGVEGGVGYIAKTFYTWGMRNSLWSQYDKNPDHPIAPYDIKGVAADEIRLNLRLLLRDRETVCNYHFDVGDRVALYQNEYALRIDLFDDFAGMPDLPYVEAVNGTGFDGLVVPWEDTERVDVGF